MVLAHRESLEPLTDVRGSDAQRTRARATLSAMFEDLLGLLALLAVSLALLIALVTAIMVRVMVRPPRRTGGNAIARGNPTDPVEAGAPGFETASVSADDGTPIELWIAQGDDREGPIVILLHGWADSRYGSLLWYPAIAPMASSVVMYDLRGHGDSRHQRFAWGRCESDDLRMIALAMREAADERSVIVLGLSMGAMIAIDAAAQSGAIDAVIADSPYAVPGEVIGRMCKAMCLPSWPMTTLAVALLSMRYPGFGSFRTADRAGQLAVPLLVMVGEADRVSPPSDAESVAAAADDSELHVFEGAGHLQAACVDRERYTQALRDFIARTRAQKRAQT